MLNVADRFYPVAALVRHYTEHRHEFAIGVEFRILREDKAESLASLRLTGDGRRAGEGAAPVTAPARDDIRDRLLRLAA